MQFWMGPALVSGPCGFWSVVKQNILGVHDRGGHSFERCQEQREKEGQSGFSVPSFYY